MNRWISNGKSAFLIYGVRQAGKTYIIRHCLKEAGCNYVEFNLIREPGIVTVLENSADTDDLFLKLSLLSHVLESRNYNLNQAVVFSNSNVESCGKIAYLPIYMLMFLEEASFEFTDISMDSFRF